MTLAKVLGAKWFFAMVFGFMIAMMMFSTVIGWPAGQRRWIRENQAIIAQAQESPSLASSGLAELKKRHTEQDDRMPQVALGLAGASLMVGALATLPIFAKRRQVTTPKPPMS